MHENGAPSRRELVFSIAPRATATLLFFIAGGLGACSPGEPEATILRVVDNYVRQKYGWPKSTYHAEIGGRQNDIFAVTVVSADDEPAWNRGVLGSSKSFLVDVDLKTKRVEREWKLQ